MQRCYEVSLVFLLYVMDAVFALYDVKNKLDLDPNWLDAVSCDY